MPQHVTDIRSNPNDQILHAVQVLGKSGHRLRVFLEIHRGKMRIKSAKEIAEAIKLPKMRVLQEAKVLVQERIVEQRKKDGETAYERDDNYYRNKQKILRFVNNPKLLKKFPTKYSSGVTKGNVIIRVPKLLIKTETITIDDIDSFKRVHGKTSSLQVVSILESIIKKGVQRIIGQGGIFKDWGGELSDLFTTRLVYRGKRYATAVAFKGRGLKGVLTPARMGKNGDQIQRLFLEDAEIFLVQYCGTIAPSVLQLMATSAQAKSYSTGKIIYYGVIDGNDTARLIAAYASAFHQQL